jgi:hypothetical protein
MPYTIYKTNGVKLTTVDDGSLNLTTDLQLVGKNYAGYGQTVNENLIKLLENFSNTSAPASPLLGQLWYDSLNKKLKVYNGTSWSQFLTTNISNSRPTDLNNGEFWFDTVAQKLWIKSNGAFILIGPSSGYSSVGGGGGTTTNGNTIGTSGILSNINVVYDIIKLAIGESIPAIVSSYAFKPDATDPLFSQYSTVTSGITLLGSDPITGISSQNKTYFWGTAADSIRLAGRPSTDYLLASQLTLVAANIHRLEDIQWIGTGSPAIPGYLEGNWTLTSGSTLEATYADIAERYHADSIYNEGTVLVVGGQNEVTVTDQRCNISVAGIVSTNPAFKLNQAVGNDDTHPYVALKGRVPCKVVGKITKGDLLVTSDTPGHAISYNPKWDNPAGVIGCALEDYEGNGPGIIEVKV